MFTQDLGLKIFQTPGCDFHHVPSPWVGFEACMFLGTSAFVRAMRYFSVSLILLEFYIVG